MTVTTFVGVGAGYLWQNAHDVTLGNNAARSLSDTNDRIHTLVSDIHTGCDQVASLMLDGEQNLTKVSRSTERIQDLAASFRVGSDQLESIVGALGRIDGDTLLQAKGKRYTLGELLGDEALAAQLRDGCYVTLRITASMYHRFHAPTACRVEQVHYFPGDTWNVNPPALDRVERLYCRNERAVLTTRMRDDTPLVMVPVAAILVASLRLHCIDLTLHARYAGPHRLRCDSTVSRGEEMGWFEHGSTIIVLLPAQAALTPQVRTGERIRMGQALFAPPSADSV